MGVNTYGLSALAYLKPMLTVNSTDIPDPTASLSCVLFSIVSTVLSSAFGVPSISNYVLLSFSEQYQINC